VRLLVVADDAPSGSERTCSALRLAGALLASGPELEADRVLTF
jgi:sulfur relay (sulfurtransferase) complex TusBCD TusD component (DsrE family)